ncbi:MAG: zinc ribbon domain-containing protein [Tissierellia bacterium]|nr:zinc ribbon domain-containing protein [Tissierellia bacterium]
MYCKNCGKKIETESMFCMHCGESTEPNAPVKQNHQDNTPSLNTGASELLEGLYYVRNQISKIHENYERQRLTVSKYREEERSIETDSVSDKSDYALLVFAVAATLFFLFIGLLTRNIF